MQAKSRRSLTSLGLSLGLVVALALTSACGFRLRGLINLPPHLQPVYIQGQDAAAALASKLEKQLSQSGVKTTSSLADSQLELVLSNLVRKEQQIVFGRVEEFELRLEVAASATSGSDEILFHQQEFSSQRLFSYDRDNDNTLTRSSNKQELYAAMEADLIRQLTFKIQSLEVQSLQESSSETPSLQEPFLEEPSLENPPAKEQP